MAYRSAADQDTATASSIAAALLSYYTIAQVDGLLAGKLGVAEAASALQIAVRFPDDGGADEVVAAIGEQILAPTDVSLSNWTVRPSSGCSVVLATHTAGAVSVDGYTLTLAVNPWNIVRTYNLTPGRELLFACRYRLGAASNFVVYMSRQTTSTTPCTAASWATRKPGALPYFTVPPNGVAKLHFGAHFQAPGLPNQTAGTVDVYGLQILDATLETGNAVEAEEDTAASALLLKHEFLDGGADDVTLATLGKVLLEPTLTTLGNFLVRSNSQSSVASASFTVGGFQLEGYAMTLSAFAWNIVRTYTLTPGRRYSFGWTRWKPGRPSRGRRIHIRNMADARRRTIKAVYKDPRTGFGSIAQTLQQAQVRDPSISRGEVKAFLDGLRVNQDRPQRGYNSFVPLEPMNQLQVDPGRHEGLRRQALPLHAGGHRRAHQESGRGAAEGPSREHHRGGHEEGLPSPGGPANVYSDDGAEFKREFKELMDFWDIEKQVTRGHAYFAERTIRTIKEAMLRRIAAGAGRRGQWHLMLADLSQINGRKHATTQVAPNLAYSDPEMAEIALRNIERRAKHKVTRPEIKVGNMVRIRVKSIESRGSYRVNKTAWSEKVYRVVSAESGEMGARFGLEGWPEKVVHRDLRKVPENSFQTAGLEVQSRQRRLQRGPRLPPF